MIYKIRVIADTQEDVFRDIEIKDRCSLEDLHLCIVDSFSLDEGNIPSFFVSDQNWSQKQEISFDAFDESQPGVKTMKNTKLYEGFKNKSDRFLYVSDFLNSFMFYVELMDVKNPEEGAEYPMLVYEYGKYDFSHEKKHIQEVEEEENESDLYDSEDIFEEYDDEFGDDFDSEEYDENYYT